MSKSWAITGDGNSSALSITFNKPQYFKVTGTPDGATVKLQILEGDTYVDAVDASGNDVSLVDSVGRVGIIVFSAGETLRVVTSGAGASTELVAELIDAVV